MFTRYKTKKSWKAKAKGGLSDKSLAKLVSLTRPQVPLFLSSISAEKTTISKTPLQVSFNVKIKYWILFIKHQFVYLPIYVLLDHMYKLFQKAILLYLLHQVDIDNIFFVFFNVTITTNLSISVSVLFLSCEVQLSPEPSSVQPKLQSQFSST